MAVSGGVDSMALLDLLSKLSDVDLVVAHFNHGIRSDSGQDEALVTATAKGYNLPLEVGRVRLGPSASEASARTARYEFLHQAKQKHQAVAIITAHHQDDLIETAIINILRGTGPRGLVAIANNQDIIRPLLHVPKPEILKYAKSSKLSWRDDPTNQDEKYLRNYVRKNLLVGLSAAQRQEFLDQINVVAGGQEEFDMTISLVAAQLEADGQIDRQLFIGLPTELGRELVAFWLRRLGYRDFDKRNIERTQMFIKTALPGSRHNLGGGFWLVVGAQTVRFEAIV